MFLLNGIKTTLAAFFTFSSLSIYPTHALSEKDQADSDQETIKLELDNDTLLSQTGLEPFLLATAEQIAPRILEMGAGLLFENIAPSLLESIGFSDKKKDYAELSENSIKRIGEEVKSKLNEAEYKQLNDELDALQDNFGEYVTAPKFRRDTLEYATNNSTQVVNELMDKKFGLNAHESFHIAASLRLLVLQARLERDKDYKEKQNVINFVDKILKHSISLNNQWRTWHDNRYSKILSEGRCTKSIGSRNNKICLEGRVRLYLIKDNIRRPTPTLAIYKTYHAPDCTKYEGRGRDPRKAKECYEERESALKRSNQNRDSAYAEALKQRKILIDNDFTEYRDKYVNPAVRLQDKWESLKYLLIARQASCRIFLESGSPKSVEVRAKKLRADKDVRDLLKTFLYSDQYRSKYAASTSKNNIIVLYERLLARKPKKEEIDQGQIELRKGNKGFDALVLRILNSEYRNRFGKNRIPNNGREGCI